MILHGFRVTRFTPLILLFLLSAVTHSVLCEAGTGSTVPGTRTTSVDKIVFQLKPNPTVLNCIAQHPGDQSHAPAATVTISRGKLADNLVLTLANFKPGLEFELFTVQRSNLKANSTPDPAFKNFGLAWYQSEIVVGNNGSASVPIAIKTILLDQIFGFDPAANLKPVRAFHIGFWFNNPGDAAACGFTGSTPFNGAHNAGPVAMISVPDAVTNLGPLCTDPNTSTHPATCNP